MSDFLLDFRSDRKANAGRSAEFFRYFPDIRVSRFDEAGFSLVITRCDKQEIWDPYRSVDGKVLLAVAGRIALEGAQWEEGREVPGSGGLARRAIYHQYRRHGVSGLKSLNGSYIVIVYDSALEKVFLVSDRCGMFPFFEIDPPMDGPAFCSHPDLLASLAQGNTRYDLTSLCEFLMAGQVSFPHTYYKGIRAGEYASIHTVKLARSGAVREPAERYFDLCHKPIYTSSGKDMAERLAAALINAVRRRTHPTLGSVAIGLSGGQDSRMILCACPEPEQITAFCFHDEENLEYRTAEAVARAKGARFLPLKRDFEYYGRSAKAGVKISGGMSSFITNHLLGFRGKLLHEGLDSILTGLYCDYLFKGLAQNRRKSTKGRADALAPFSLEWYLPFFALQTSEGLNVQARLEQIFPRNLREDQSEASRLEIERKRLFPLCYEPENAEVLIPQRVLGWYMPIVDNDVIDVYLSMPLGLKLDHSVYEKVVQIICGDEVCNIPNSNTGMPIREPGMTDILLWRARSIQGRILKRLRPPRLATSSSWPNWEYYIHHSSVLSELWRRNNPEANELFRDFLGYDPFGTSIGQYRGKDRVLFERLLTLKIWLEQRCS